MLGRHSFSRRTKGADDEFGGPGRYVVLYLRRRCCNGQELSVYAQSLALFVPKVPTRGMHVALVKSSRKTTCRYVRYSSNVPSVLGRDFGFSCLVLLHPPLPVRVSPAAQPWVPRSARAYTAADHASVANAREHHASLVYEVREFRRASCCQVKPRGYEYTCV